MFGNESILSLILNTTSYYLFHIFCYKQFFLSSLWSVFGCGKHVKHWKRFLHIFYPYIAREANWCDKSGLVSTAAPLTYGLKSEETELDEGFHSLFIWRWQFSFFDAPVSYWWGFLNYAKKDSKMWRIFLLSTFKNEPVNRVQAGRWGIYVSRWCCVLFFKVK